VKFSIHAAAALLGAAVFAPALPAADGVPPAIERILQVGREGAGNAEAAVAWRTLAAQGPETILTILPHVSTDKPLAANWLRTAVEAIAGKTTAAGKPLPKTELEAFVRDRKNSPAGRFLAYELLVRADDTAPERLLPGMLEDPSAGLRRLAIQRRLQPAQKQLSGDGKEAALAEIRKLFTLARDKDQVDDIVALLKKHGDKPDLTKHFGFVTGWWLIGPFDNVNGVGYDKAYPPETKVDLAALPIGKDGKTPLAWTAHTTTDPLGQVDLNKAIAKHMGAVGYAYVAVESPAETQAEFRTGCNNAVKVFLNGKLVASSPIYHNGTRMDHYTAPVTLRKGRNEVLLKVCQNEQTENWAQDWGFQFRICDAIGGALPLTYLPPVLDDQPAKEKP
jgi:hypothetical protein